MGHRSGGDRRWGVRLNRAQPADESTRPPLRGLGYLKSRSSIERQANAGIGLESSIRVPGMSHWIQPRQRTRRECPAGRIRRRSLDECRASACLSTSSAEAVHRLRPASALSAGGHRQKNNSLETSSDRSHQASRARAGGGRIDGRGRRPLTRSSPSPRRRGPDRSLRRFR
jgi:hypothetical protein